MAGQYEDSIKAVKAYAALKELAALPERTCLLIERALRKRFREEIKTINKLLNTHPNGK